MSIKSTSIYIFGARSDELAVFLKLNMYFFEFFIKRFFQEVIKNLSPKTSPFEKL